MMHKSEQRLSKLGDLKLGLRQSKAKKVTEGLKNNPLSLL